MREPRSISYDYDTPIIRLIISVLMIKSESNQMQSELDIFAYSCLCRLRIFEILCFIVRLQSMLGNGLCWREISFLKLFVAQVLNLG